MPSNQGYLIVDVGTGNARVAIVSVMGELVGLKRANVIYEKDNNYPEALYFEPKKLWEQILEMAKELIKEVPPIHVHAITASSQREGIVLLDAEGNTLTGLPNHDHRGREWENTGFDKSRVYELTGRYPTSLFSALKLVGVREKREEIFTKTAYILSISDWVQYMFSGVTGYEHSQASETLLYDVAGMCWSQELCSTFDIDPTILPPLHHSGDLLGKVLPKVAGILNLSPEAQVIVGGADTQLAIKSTQPGLGDIVLVSGTTTPVVKITDTYKLDAGQRTWTGRHVDRDQFVLEANAGVTGLNYQRLKEIFYPNEGYDVIEAELKALDGNSCVASLGSLIANETTPLTKGGFFFSVPVSHELNRADFIQSALWDIACSIKENYEILVEIEGYDKDYVWACGGGFQSNTLTKYLADLLGKRIRIRDDYSQASVLGAALVCRETLGRFEELTKPEKEIKPEINNHQLRLYKEWKKCRENLHQLFGKGEEE